MELSPEGPKAIPLWVNGHAFLTVTESFFDVTDQKTGAAIRRVPLCGADEAAAAVSAAEAAQAIWAERGLAGRQELLNALADGLEGYTAHFAGLIVQETGCSEAAGESEVQQAVAALRAGSVGMTGLFGVVTAAAQPLAALARLAAPALMAGATLVIKPSPRAPSAAFALCELSSRVGWPGGVLNLLQGDTAAVEGLCAAPIDRLLYAGDASLGESIRRIAEQHALPVVIEVL